MMTDSQKLLAEYVRNGSETAFRELVTRYVDLVYSTAVRLVNADAARAEDVAQMVFEDLARMARSFPEGTMLGGWLHHHTVFVASTMMRGERRRQIRERQAAEMNALQDHTQANLAQVAPILDEAIDQLSADERSAILLRFFEQLDFRSVGEALGSTEEAARKRVSRALEKLHSLLQNRGVSLSAAALGTALATEALTAAPVGLAASSAGTALASVAGGGTALTLTALKIAAMTKLRLGIVSAIVVAGLATPFVMQHQSRVKLRQEYQILQQQATQLAEDNERLSNLVARAKSTASLPTDQPQELLRLRGEVGMLRQQTNELGKLRQENRKLLAQSATQTDTNQDSAEDQFTLRQTHVLDAMTTLLQAIKNYTTNHNGLYPGDFDQLKASGDLMASNLAGNLGLGDFEFGKEGALDPQGNKIILSLRVPIPKPGGGSVMVLGGITDDGLVHTSVVNVSPEAVQIPPAPPQ